MKDIRRAAAKARTAYGTPHNGKFLILTTSLTAKRPQKSKSHPEHPRQRPRSQRAEDEIPATANNGDNGLESLCAGGRFDDVGE